jgi:sugar phosphate isomerase/epimerase
MPSGSHRGPLISRRLLLGAAVGAVGSAIGRPARARAAGLSRGYDYGIRLGVASYSLRQWPRSRAIAAIRELRSPWVNVKSFHLPYEASSAELAVGRREFENAGLEIVGGGTITLEHDDDTDVRTYFEYARAAGFPLMVIAPRPNNLARIERFVREYDIKVAIHNHGPEDPYFPAPSDALEHIADMDPRIGLCVDVGHTARTGNDVVREIADAGRRVLDLHFKDLRDLRDKDSQCIVGEGEMPVTAIFRQLHAMSYGGYVNLEYEIDADNPLPGMKQSFAYMRGVLAGLDAS